MILMWIDSLLDWAKFLGSAWYYRLRWVVVQVLTIVILFITLLWLAVFMYASFYYSYMPSVSHIKDVHLQFSSSCDTRDGMCSFPSANISLLTDGSKEILRRGQIYVISFEMTLPESPANQQLGMFMVKVQTYAKHGEVVRTSHRSAMLGYKSSLLLALETWTFLPFLVLGNSKQQQLLSVEMFDQYQEDPYKPAVGVFIEVQSKHVQLYHSQLHIHARFSGLRYLMYHYPVLSSLVAISINMFFLLVITLLSWYRFGAQVTFEEAEPVAATGLTLEERRSRARLRLARGRQDRRSQTAETESGATLVRPASSPALSATDTTMPPTQPETIASQEAGGTGRAALNKDSSGEDGSGSNGEDAFELVKGKDSEQGDEGSKGQESGGIRQRRITTE